MTIRKTGLFSTLALLLAFSSAHAADKKKESPFLGDYSAFTRSKERKSMLVYRNPGKRAIDYKKIYFEPVQIMQSPHSEYKHLTDQDKKVLSDLYQSMAKDTFKDVVEIADAPGEGVLTVRTALRGLKQGRYRMNELGTETITPNSKMPAGTFEVEGVDTVAKERVIALVDSIEQKKVNGPKEELVLTVTDLFRDWLDALKTQYQQKKAEATLPK